MVLVDLRVELRREYTIAKVLVNVFSIMRMTTIGAAGVEGFVYIEVFRLRAICPWCTIVHALGLAILVFSITGGRAPCRKRPHPAFVVE